MKNPWWGGRTTAPILRLRRPPGGIPGHSGVLGITQYLSFTEWEELHTYAREKGIGVLGDMPVYVALDSADM